MLEGRQRRLVHKFNSVYGDTLIDPKILLPRMKHAFVSRELTVRRRWSNLSVTVFICQRNLKILRRKYSACLLIRIISVWKIREVSKEIIVFTYLDAFCKTDILRNSAELSELDELKAHYQRGGLGDTSEEVLNNVLQAELEPIRNRRKELQKDIPAITRS